MKLKFEKVESERISFRAYDEKRKVIVLRFPDGAQYEYAECNAQVWKDFRKARSAGGFLFRHLNLKPFKRIDNWK